MPSWFILGIDNLIISEKVLEICDRIQPKSFYADEVELDELADSILSPDLFSESSQYWIKEVSRLRFSKKVENVLERLLKLLPDKTNLIVSQETYFGGEYGEFRRFEESRLFKKLKELASNFVEVRLGYGALRRWVEKRAKEKYGLILRPSQVEALVFSALELPSLIDCELKKLSLLKTRDRVEEIADTVFQLSISKTLSSEFSQVRNLVLARDMNAIPALFEMYRREARGAELLRDLYRNFELLQKVKVASRAETELLLKRVGETRKRLILESSANWSPASVVSALRLITETEFKSRTGRIGGKTPDTAERDMIAILIKKLVAI